MSRKLILIFAVLLLAAAIFWKLLMANFLASKLETAFSDACQTCHLKIKNTHLSLLSPSSFAFDDVQITSGEEGASEVHAVIAEIKGKISWRQMLSHNLKVNSLELKNVEVVFRDGEKPKPKEQPKPAPKTEWTFVIASTSITHGFFEYERTLHGQKSVFKIHNIDAKMAIIGNTPELEAKIVEASASGQIENSGHVVLKVASPVFAKKLFVDVDFNVVDQDLSDLNHFFEKNEGVVLKGILKKGHATVEVRGEILKSQVHAAYENFAVNIRKNADRSEIMAFFTNLGTAISLRSKNLKDSKAEQTQSTELTRKEKEPIVAFILRGMKEAAIKVASIL